jgi:nitrate reductase gamma subunit
MTPLTTILWLLFPYVCLTICVAGHIWRFQTDGFQWSKRTLRAADKRRLGLASAAFHYGIVASLAGHALGLLLPSPLLTAAGLDPARFRAAAALFGIVAGSLSATGFATLMYRRLTNAHLRKRSTGFDGLSYGLLGIIILIGLVETLRLTFLGGGYDDRATAGVWLRGLLTLSPNPRLIAGASIWLRAHVIAGLLLGAIWPFTRLVHVWSAPAQSLWKPAVYRSRFARE